MYGGMCEDAEMQESLVSRSISSIDQVLFLRLCHLIKCLTLIRLIAATISIRLLGRPTSKLPMYCKKTMSRVREFVARDDVCMCDHFHS